MRHKKTSQTVLPTRKSGGRSKRVSSRMPAGLGPDGAEWWVELAAHFGEESASVRLVMEVCVLAVDRLAEARESIRVHGLVNVDRYNQVRSNPAVAVEDKARTTILHAIKALRQMTNSAGANPKVEAFLERIRR